MVSKSVEDVQKEFFGSLLTLGLTHKEALNITSTFLLAWIRKDGENANPKRYENDVNTFINKFKESRGR